ncbi:MAG: FtsX-like permease family protein [Saccharofermentanales bacterium]
MNFRNSIKSTVRTPVRTGLFLLLIAAVTVFLFLSLNTWFASRAILRDSNQVFTTIVTLKYRDVGGTGEGYLSSEVLADLEAIDFDALASNVHVKDWQPSSVSYGSAQGFMSKARSSRYAYTGVFLVTGLRPYNAQGSYTGKVVETLYSMKPYEPGRTIYFQGSFEEVGFEPDQGATYIIHTQNMNLDGSGLALQIVPFYSSRAEDHGIDTGAISPFCEVRPDQDPLTPETAIYYEIAAYYDAMNRALPVYSVKDLSEIEEFHQNYLLLEAGRLFTREEAEAGKKLAVISTTVANRLELELGDDLTVLMPEEAVAGFYEWGLELTRQETYEIVGIVGYHENYHENIYVAAAAVNARPTGYDTNLGQATIENGSTASFLSEIQPYLSDDIVVTAYDQGYQTMADSISVVRKASVALSIITFFLTLSVLIFFAYQYAGSQREAVGIMRSFGATKKESRRYLLAGSGLISLAAVTGGILIGMHYAEDLVSYVLDFVSDLQVVDIRYSDGFHGLVKSFSPVISLSYGFAVAVGLAVLVLALGLLLYFAERTISGRLISHREKVHIPRPVKDSSVAFRGSLRQALLAMRRSKGRSFLTLLLAVTTLLFLASIPQMLTSYKLARNELHEGTVLTGYASKRDGHFSDQLVIPNSQAKTLLDHVQGIEEVAYSYKTHYQYLGVDRHADGSPGDAQDMPIITSSYQLENVLAALYYQPNIVFTDQVSQAPEFLFSQFLGSFMEGWSQERFSRRDWDILPVIIPDAMMSAYGIEYGDTISFYTQDHFYEAHSPSLRFMEAEVVGSFKGLTAWNHIYAPLPLGALEPENSSLRTILQEMGRADLELETGRYRVPFGFWKEFNDQQILDISLDNYYLSSMTFKIKDPARLTEVRDSLEVNGFSGPGVKGSLSSSIVLEDSQFLESVRSIDQRSFYLELLYPVLLVLVMLLGLLTGFLSVRARRENIALMRSLGTKKSAIFRTIFGEQALLLLLGGGIGAVLWLFLRGPAELLSVKTYAFMMGYVASAFISIILQNRKSALSVLSEKE